MDELPMTNLNHPNGVSRKFYDLMQEIEKLPASEQQTRCCIKTSEVQTFVLAILAALNADRSAESEHIDGLARTIADFIEKLANKEAELAKVTRERDVLREKVETAQRFVESDLADMIAAGSSYSPKMAFESLAALLK